MKEPTIARLSPERQSMNLLPAKRKSFDTEDPAFLRPPGYDTRAPATARPIFLPNDRTQPPIVPDPAVTVHLVTTQPPAQITGAVTARPF